MAREYYLYVNGQKVSVSEDVYKVYWRLQNHEDYLKRVDMKNHLLFFSAIDHDGHFAESIVDKNCDVERLVEEKMIEEEIHRAISRLDAKEQELIERLYFEGESLVSIAKEEGVSYQAIQCRKKLILKKLRQMLEGKI